METIEYRTFDKSTWGPGEWQNEPDKKQWLDPESGYPCLIVRSHTTGALCGYVGVPEGHSFFGKDCNDMVCPMDTDLIIHGGITFAGTCTNHGNEREGICHKDDGDDLVWWIGFDCAHGGDIMPKMNFVLAPLNLGPRAHYRNLAYVTSEVESLAMQLKEIARGTDGVAA